MRSSIYTGIVSHHRWAVADHRFQYGIGYCWIDLDEYQHDVALRKLLSGVVRPWAFRAADHGGGDKEVSELVSWVRKRAQEHGLLADGPVRLLTQLRNWGLAFSPLNVYYLYDRNDRLTGIIGEVTNTPWGERHWYVLPATATDAGADRYTVSHTKQFHVSPFWEMNLQYGWSLNAPGPQLDLWLDCYRATDRVFRAGMKLRRQPLTAGTLWRLSLTNYRMLAGIYYQALRLWWKRCPVYNHPRNADPLSVERTVTGRTTRPFPLRTAEPAG
ncbi:MAG: DUF1365 domain-containing protein [Pirellulales bacterium]